MFAIWGGFSLGNPWTGMLFIVGFGVGVAVHELIHGFTWMWATHSGFRHLRFGLLRGGVYCHIDVPMSRRKYVVGALMPLLLLGVVPFLLSFATNSLWLMLFGACFIGCAMGDVLIVWAIRKDITTKLLTEAVITDAQGNVLINLAQQDAVALRVVFRAGWALANPVNRVNATAASRYPFAVLKGN